MGFTREQAADLHRRLLAGEPDAPADLVDALLLPLIRSTRSRFPRLSDPTLVDSLVIDALLAYVKEPGRYDPGRSSLWSYLTLVVHRDLLNALESERRRAAHETPLEDVELRLADRKISVPIEEWVMRRLAPEGLPDRVDLDEVKAEVDQAFREPGERALLQLYLDGVFRTEEFARVMGILHLPEAEQRRQVKRAKDRIAVRLRRIGQRLQARAGSLGR